MKKAKLILFMIIRLIFSFIGTIFMIPAIWYKLIKDEIEAYKKETFWLD